MAWPSKVPPLVAALTEAGSAPMELSASLPPTRTVLGILLEAGVPAGKEAAGRLALAVEEAAWETALAPSPRTGGTYPSLGVKSPAD